MRALSILFLFILLAEVLSAQDQSAKAAPASDAESAISAVFKAQVAAWNRGDLKGFMQGYWNSPDLVFASGTREIRGWDRVYQRYQTRYQSGDQEMGKLYLAYFDGVHLLSPELAYIDGEYRLTMSSGKESHGVFTLIFRKFPEGWRIVHDRTCSE